MDDLQQPPLHTPASEPPATRLPLAGWLREGLRAGVLMRLRLAGQQPTPLQLAGLLLLLSAIELGLGRLEVAGPASFGLQAWLAPYWGTAALLLLAWWTLWKATPQQAIDNRPSGLAAWFTLWMVAVLPANLVAQGLGIAQAHELLPAALAGGGWWAWALYLGLWVWTLAVALRLAVQFGAGWRRLLVFGIGLAGLFALTAWQFPDRAWTADFAQVEGQEPTQLQLSQEVFETQQAVWAQAVDALAPQRPGVADVYGLVFAPYAEENVFLRESSLVAGLLAERFDARGRVLHLVNHASTAGSLPWATPQNLERAIGALAARMDVAQDILVVYLTSHGANDYRLAASHGPLEVEPISPGELRAALDKAGIRHRVIAVSACYSGGWIGPLADENSLVMTAADATHTSYGCGRLSELTFFGRAVFDEQLRKTHSFEAAFAAAVPLIRQREIDAGKSDGFSNPQISVGAAIAPVLRSLEQRLDGR